MNLRTSMAFVTCAAVLASAPAFSASQVDDQGRPVVQEQPAANAGGENWGTTTDIIYNVGADDFSVRLLGWTNAQLFNNAEIQPSANGTLSISGPIHLPSGALMKSLTVFYRDTDTAGDPSGQLWRSDGTGALTVIQNITFPAFSAGANNFTVVLPGAGVQIDNLNSHYAVNYALTRTATGFAGMFRTRVTYRLQVSPAPANATFPNDVPTSHPFFRFVEAMAASGLTGGCSAGSFCPDAPVTRGQLSVFLASALGLHFPN